MSRLPDGSAAPPDGHLPPAALASLTQAPFGIYLHVPFCARRCGYCDFNTYAPADLPDAARSPGRFVEAALAEIALARTVLPSETPPAATVFVGGGTPTVLPAGDLVRLLTAIRDTFGLQPGAEVTTEANPDSVTPASLAELAAGGYTRVSFGMQSAVPHVLAALQRTHTPANVERGVRAARAAGLAVSLDLIYGTAGESRSDWQASLQAAVELAPDHLSAYALVVEDGTALAAAVRRGETSAPTDDDEADKYELADELLTAAGYRWYEVSNWSTWPHTRCRHNEGYWRGGSWWGIGPGAHSHVGGVRWWNVKHPDTYAQRLADGLSPAAARELLTDDQRYDELVLTGVRLVDGLALDQLRTPGRAAVAALVADGLCDGRALVAGRRVVLTRRGRLLADTVVRRLLGW